MVYGSVPIGDGDPDKLVKARIQEEADREEQLAQSKNAAVLGSTTKQICGYLTVKRQFDTSSGSIFALGNNSTDMSGGELNKLDVEGLDPKVIEGAIHAETAAHGQPSGGSAPSTYSQRIAQTYRSVMDARSKKAGDVKDMYYCVLKGSVLFLYDTEEQKECLAAIGVDKYIVGMETSEGGKFSGRDSEMFNKRNALVLRLADTKTDEENGSKKGLPVLAKGMNSEGVKDGSEQNVTHDMENRPWFFTLKQSIK